MVFWVLLLIVILLLLLGKTREHYVDIPGPGTRPSLEDAAWRSKIEVQAPLGANIRDYELSLQSFYDTVYKPIREENPSASIPAPTVEVFLNSQPVTVSKDIVRRILLAGFAIDRSETAAAREEKQLVTTGALKGFASKGGSQIIEPKNGIDGTWPQYADTKGYKPSDSRSGVTSEGMYGPLEQQETPRREGLHDDKSTSWTQTQYYGVCTDDSCIHNIL